MADFRHSVADQRNMVHLRAHTFAPLTANRGNTMNRRNILSLSAIMAAGLALLPGSVSAQQKSLKEQLVGTYTLVSVASTAQNGTKVDLFGNNPEGLIIFDAGGHYTQVLVRPDRPKYKANNRLEGTAEENKAALAGGIGQFGTWSVNEADKSLTLHQVGVVHFPNEEGTDQKRAFSLAGDELKIIIAVTGDGGRNEQVWKRAK
jgi:Lipocalin-like domain